MPRFTQYTQSQLDQALQRLAAAIYTKLAPLEIRAWCTPEPVAYAERRTGEEKVLEVGDTWGGLFDCAWFRFTGTVPASAAGLQVVLLLDVNGELCVVDGEGVPVRGLTNVASTFDLSLGLPGKRVLQVTDAARGGEPVEVWADAGCNDLFGQLQQGGAIAQAEIAACNQAVRQLYYDYEVLLDFFKALPADSPRRAQIGAGLTDVAHLLPAGAAAVVEPARARLWPLLERQGGDAPLRISAVGHAHMDLAWLWPIRETVRKGARTFATALDLMERYPDYVFGASQPQLWQWMKEDYPRLYAKLRQKVKEGRLEPQGVMWVEADTNVSGGEALVRQILLGRRFFRQELGVDVDYLWLPDVFGYSGALPQILAKAGVRYFSTQKLSWSLINAFPHQSFVWQGIDGSRVLTHMLPEETYNGPALPRSIRRIESNYRDKDVSGCALMAFGIGDGGGGPGAEHLERLQRLRHLEGLSPVQQEWAARFLERWAEAAERLPTWVGELYLERHQGTLTTQARNKRYNRKLELALRDWEWSAAAAGLLTGYPYPRERLDAVWREVLLYQFHDILPGSSIKRVYDECVPRYQALLAEAEEGIGRAVGRIAAAVRAPGLVAPALVWNSLSWERTDWVRAGHRWLRVRVPALGYVTVDAGGSTAEHTAGDGRAGEAAPGGPGAPQPGAPGGLLLVLEPGEVAAGLRASERLLENELLRVTFAADGAVASVYDKRVDREALPRGAAGNRLAVYEDLGDAWDFAMDYAEQEPRSPELVSATPSLDGPRAVLTQVYRIGHSEITQEIALAADSARIDFNTRLRWREVRSMLRTSFPVKVHADEATFEIQFGHIRRPTHRNTSWDLARDEVAAQRWADLSQRDYGVAPLNDGKYGHKVKGQVLDLNLLRSVPHPGPRLVRDEEVAPGAPHGAYTDQCDHAFTYALYPHPGDWAEGEVVRAGYELNVPLWVVPLPGGPGTVAERQALLQVDAPNVVVEAVKRAEPEVPGWEVGAGPGDLIVRLYESEHRGTRVALRFGFPVAAATVADLMEAPVGEPLKVVDGVLHLALRPLEIVTLRVQPERGQDGVGI
ncbi:MAG: glycoside hydrolase family 38 C-terminal domain-containing protein [Gemmatimonadota bacterium]